MNYSLTNRQRRRFRLWFFEGLREPVGPHARHVHQYAWWKVMCLTGVDYFSTLGYQPGIAFLAAGALSPIATFVLVLLTLFGALPIYRRVAEHSPHGQGSISMLEELLPRWRGKAFVLVLLGFAATDFVITITLSAADATAHIIGNPFFPDIFHHQIGMTFVLLGLLSGVFLKGFREAIGLAVGIVGAYLALNLVVIGTALDALLHHAEYIPRWKDALVTQHGSPVMMVAFALLLFPKLALGLSGFETGVALMPLVKSDKAGDKDLPGRVRNTKKLLGTAALIMSVMLMGSAFVTTLLIPPALFRAGGAASGRALSYLAHTLLGEKFGTVYDLSTIAILWFAGASAMAGLLNLVPKYLPRYGMAPEWTKATRPLVLLFTAITFLITYIFSADVEAQGGAYATGVLVLMTSAAVAATLAAFRRHMAVRFRVCRDHAGVRLHDDHQRHRTAGRREDRLLVHRHDHRDVDDLARHALDGAAHQGRRTGRAGETVHPGGRRRARANHREPARYRTPRGIRAQAEGSERIAPPAAGRAGCCFSRSVRATSRSSPTRSRSRGWTSADTTCCAPRARPSPTPSRRCCCIAATRRARSRTPISAGPKAIRSPTC